MIRIAPKQIMSNDISGMLKGNKLLTAVNVTQTAADFICYVGRDSIYCMKLNISEQSVSFHLYYNDAMKQYAHDPNSIIRKFCSILMSKYKPKIKTYT